MITAIIILAYVFNVFLNRWLNKIGWVNYGLGIFPTTWFLPVLTTFALIVSLVYHGWNSISSQSNWFNGKGWKQK